MYDRELTHIYMLKDATESRGRNTHEIPTVLARELRPIGGTATRTKTGGEEVKGRTRLRRNERIEIQGELGGRDAGGRRLDDGELTAQHMRSLHISAEPILPRRGLSSSR